MVSPSASVGGEGASVAPSSPTVHVAEETVGATPGSDGAECREPATPPAEFLELKRLLERARHAHVADANRAGAGAPRPTSEGLFERYRDDVLGLLRGAGLDGVPDALAARFEMRLREAYGRGLVPPAASSELLPLFGLQDLPQRARRLNLWSRVPLEAAGADEPLEDRWRRDVRDRLEALGLGRLSAAAARSVEAKLEEALVRGDLPREAASLGVRALAEVRRVEATAPGREDAARGAAVVELRPPGPKSS